MRILDDIKGIVGEFRSGLAELAQQDQVRIAEAQELRRTIARQAETIDEQVQLIARQRAEINKVTAEAATMRAQLDHGARVLGERIDWHRAQGGTLLAKTKDGRIVPAAGRIAMPVLDVHPSHLTDVLTAAEDDRREALAHVRTLLGILDATGGFMSPDYQAAIRSAREAVAG